MKLMIIKLELEYTIYLEKKEKKYIYPFAKLPCITIKFIKKQINTKLISWKQIERCVLSGDLEDRPNPMINIKDIHQYIRIWNLSLSIVYYFILF